MKICLNIKFDYNELDTQNPLTVLSKLKMQIVVELNEFKKAKHLDIGF